MGLVKINRQDRVDADRRALYDVFSVMIVGGRRVKENVVQIKRWAWSPALEMWVLVAYGDFTTKAAVDIMDGVEMPVGDTVYTVHLLDTERGLGHRCGRWAASFHEAAIRTIGQTNIAWSEDTEEQADVTPFEGAL